MDRHDVPENVSPELLAEIHQEDLKIEHEFGCRGFTYWFDNKRKNVFCLIEAPSREAIEHMHKHAHGNVPNTIIEVEPNLVESFLGRISDPDPQNGFIDESPFRIIMLIRLPISPNPPSKTLATGQGDFDKELLKQIETHQGTLVKQDSTNYLISFESAKEAIQCAFNTESLLEHYKKTPLNKAKIGIASGLPVAQKASFFEDAISLASHMCEHINAEIIISHEVKKLFEKEKCTKLSLNEKTRALKPLEEKFLLQVMDVVEASWQNPSFNLDAFCKELGYSKSQLYRKLMALTGKSPNTFIRDYKLEKALNLLEQQQGNISEIAFSTGFNSLAYFSKCFKNKFNMLPSAYIQDLNQA